MDDPQINVTATGASTFNSAAFDTIAFDTIPNYGADTAPTSGDIPRRNDDMNRDDMNTNVNAKDAKVLNENDTIRVPVVEEHLNVQKGMQQAGEVDVTKRVVEEQVNVPVELSREHVNVQRHAVDRPLQPGETTIGENDVIRVPVMEEVANVTKTAHVIEEIEIAKTRETQQQNVGDTVRKEVVDVNDATKRTDTTGRGTV